MVASVSPVTDTGAPTLPPVVPFPSCPSGLLPQHFTSPEASEAQAMLSPTLIDAAVVMPDTATGVDELV